MQSVATVAFAGTRGHYGATLAGIEGVPQLRVTGLCPASDPIDPLTSWCATRGHEAKVYEDYVAMLEGARPDMVVVCGPFESHAAMCAAAIERGVHVLTEKPAALDYGQLELLRGACARRPGVHLAGMMFSRFSPGILAARRAIEEGVIGRVRLVDARKSYKLGVRPGYYRDRSTYGGTIPWIGSHAIDWVLYLTGLRFKSVYATHSAVDNGGNGTMERSALCHFTLEGEVFASVSVDVFRPGGALTHGDDWARVVGTEGVMEVRPDSVVLTTGTSGPTAVPLGEGGSLVRDFVDHVEGRSRGGIDAESTLALTEACLRARQSADEGRVVGFAEGV